jgi:hypothetical protein
VEEVSAMQYEYLVCLVQSGRVTFVNGEWQGTVQFGTTDTQAALDSCPQVWDYLNSAGSEGWELIGAVNIGINHSQEMSPISSNLFLKRQKYSQE